ncbi:MAG: Kelch repeat-containing protein [Planctomycetota bacterium]
MNVIRTLFVSALATGTLAAQFDYDLEKRTSGRLGEALELDVVAAPPASLALIVPSTTSGPTPLSLIDPADSRVLAVGTDLLSALSVLVTDAAGDAAYSFQVPSAPNLAGFELHWQSVSLLFGATLIGELSNPVVTLTGAPDTSALAPSAMQSARAFAANLIDANNNASANDVLVTGGGGGTLTNAVGLATTERWDFRRMRFVPGPTMGSARALHSAVRLNDDRVLMIGGANQTGAVLNSCEIYDPNTDSFSPTGSMGTPRILFGACLLADGRVMVAGGTSTLTPDITAAVTSTLRSAEIYDPATGTWSGTSSLGGNRLAPALTQLAGTGDVLATGGIEITFVFGFPIGATSTTNVQRWNPSSGSWSNGPNMAQGRAGHQYNQVTLNDGRVLLTGGVLVPSLLNAASAAPIQGAEIYDPVANSWQTANMSTARALHSATVLGDGRVAVCGGAQGTLTAPTSLDTVEVFDPTTNTWAAAPSLTGGVRASHTAELLPDGTLVLIGGQGGSATTPTVETLRF